MNHEQIAPHAHEEPYKAFGFTENEHLFWRVNNDRFNQILNDDRTIIHTIKEFSNSYGDFLFVTASRPGEGERLAMTFYSLGYHELREIWITQEWFWYQATMNPELLEQ